MKTFNRLILAGALIAAAALTACGDAATAQTSTETKVVEDTTAAAEAETLDENEQGLADAIAAIPEVDYGGYEFTILDRSAEQDVNWECIDVYAEAENGDVINDAVYQRNLTLEEAMNIKIKANPVQLPYSDARKNIIAGDDSFDLVTDGLNLLAANLATNGYLIDLLSVDGLDLSSDWWDQQMNNDLTIQGKLYFTTGDISIMDNYGTWCVMFNKTIASENDLDDIYALVRDGKWTLDTMYDMAKTCAKDLNGDGVMDSNDQYGFYSENYNNYALWASGGNRIITKDSDDNPVLASLTDSSVSCLQTALEFQLDKSCSIYLSTTYDTNELFGNGYSLFIYGGMWLITKFRAYDVNFGVVPSPKYTEAQDRYYNTYSGGNCTAYSIPVTASDLTRTATIMEAMAHVSKYTLTPAYYEKALKGKYVRDEESAEMLDIILAQRSYDLGNIFDWGSMLTMITGLSKKDADVASSFAKKENAANKAITKFIDSLEEN